MKGSFPYSSHTHFCSLRSVRKKRLLAFFTKLNWKYLTYLVILIKRVKAFHVLLFSLSLMLAIGVRSTAWNILNIWILRKFYFAYDFIVLRSVSPQKILKKFIFSKTMEKQRRRSDSKYKHSIYHLFNSIYRLSGKELCSDTNEIQQTHCIQFD